MHQDYDLKMEIQTLLIVLVSCGVTPHNDAIEVVLNKCIPAD